MHCVKCGYELHGLTVPGECPECGKPLEATTLMPLLRQAAAPAPDDRPRRRPLHRILIALGAIVLVVLAMVVIAYLAA